MSEEMETMKPAHLQAEIRVMTVSGLCVSFMSLKAHFNFIILVEATNKVDVLKNKCMIVTSNALVYVR